MTRSVLCIHETPQRGSALTSKLQLQDVPRPALLPTGPLPSRARIDYRRWCEIEFSVYCRNIGLVDANALLANVANRQHVGFSAGTDRRDLDVVMDD